MTKETLPDRKDKVENSRRITDIEKVDQLAPSEKCRLREVTDKFAFRVSEYYLNLINWDDPDDPIRRLVIPHERELNAWGELDASNESAITVAHGVQHKYSSTVLLLTTEMCSSFCRYCFRKRLFMRENEEVAPDFSDGIEYVRNHPEVDNILLSGGDPLVLSTARLRELIVALREIKHIRIIRIGTKTPAFNPFRIIDDPGLLELFREYSRPESKIYLMCHFDHVRELTSESREAIRLVQKSGVICLNQNPIIHGISDNAEAMSRLWNELSFMGITQYYIFQGRPTAGNEPYEVPIVRAYFLIEEAKRNCSGIAKQIRYVMSHESGKIEVVGVDQDYIYLRYHRAMNEADEQRFFVCHRNDNAVWLDQLKPVEGSANEYYDPLRAALTA